MNIGYFNHTLDLSVRSYIDNVVRELEGLGASMLPFVAGETPPARADLYWDPRLTGGTPPWGPLAKSGKPVVVTAHDGGFLLSRRPWELYASPAEAVRGTWGGLKRTLYWKRWRGRCSAIITVSEFARAEIARNLGLGRENIVPIHHGVDHDLFAPRGTTEPAEPFFLHVSAYHPVKNLKRMLRAYEELDLNPKPRLVVVAPRCPDLAAGAGVEIHRDPLPHRDLAPLYREALGFLFPSLYESFGMPILEAMAAGCPVMTAHSTGCAEVAGDAALLVDPRSTEQIRGAMHQLATSPETRAALREKGLRQARRFSWSQAAERHLNVFRACLEASRQ